MPQSLPVKFNPELDLLFERVVDVPRELIWLAWTKPEHLMNWFCPLPWKTTECEIDLRVGGLFRSVMRSPEGEVHDNVGCYLELIENEKLVWTSALLPGFRPSGNPFITAILTFTDVPGGTRYTAHVLHKDAADRQKHEEMGFHTGWGIALDQLVAHVKTLGR